MGNGAGESNVIRAGTAKAWGGRFGTTPDQRLEAFNASVGFDVRMAREDIRGSIAHVRMLSKQGIIPAEDASTIESGLWSVLDEVEAGTFTLTVADEDIHTGVENRLRTLIGPVTGKLHTGRSRNDQVALDVRLWTKGALLEVIDGVLDLTTALLDVADTHPDVAMPGYTHLQRAQPVLLAHHLHAYVAMLERDAERLREAYRRADVSPLGAAALAGATYPLDREASAADMGLSAISANSLDAVSDRDFVLDAHYACTVIAIHISRLSEEIILWASAEFGFIDLSDAFSTGSSIMPQKKNPDVAELARGKSGRVLGNLVALLTIVKGLPMTYNKDMQEDKEGLFDSVDTLLAVLDVYPPMLRTTKFNRERLADAAVANFSLATDAADMLAKSGIPFREAHETVGTLVRRCIDAGKTFADLTDAEWGEIHPVFAGQRPPLTALESIAARDVPGGTAPGRVATALATSRQIAARNQAWLTTEQSAREQLFARP
jgi:argininosuccinate lyase